MLETTNENETEYYEKEPEDLTDVEREARDSYILTYLKECFKSSPEGRELLRDAEVEADKWLLEQRRLEANEGLTSDA